MGLVCDKCNAEYSDFDPVTGEPNLRLVWESITDNPNNIQHICCVQPNDANDPNKWRHITVYQAIGQNNIRTPGVKEAAEHLVENCVKNVTSEDVDADT